MLRTGTQFSQIDMHDPNGKPFLSKNTPTSLTESRQTRISIYWCKVQDVIQCATQAMHLGWPPIRHKSATQATYFNPNIGKKEYDIGRAIARDSRKTNACLTLSAKHKLPTKYIARINFHIESETFYKSYKFPQRILQRINSHKVYCIV